MAQEKKPILEGWYEKNWKPVKLKQVAYPSGAVSSFSKAMDWFSKLLINEGKRDQKLTRYDIMDSTVDISRALDIIAEDISSEGADDDATFILDFEEEAKPKESLVKTLNSTLTLWEKKTLFDYKFFDYIREMLKYGHVIFRVNKDGSLYKLVPQRIEGYKLDDKDDSIVTHYIYNPSKTYKNKNDDTIHGDTRPTEEKELIPVDQLLILKVGDGPFGESILERVYRVWKQLQLLEDSVVIYRIVRAPERRVFYIDIGKMPSHKAEAHIESVKDRMRQRQVSRDGDIETDYNPASMQEDYFIGQTGDGRGSRVETLPGGDNLGRIEDLQFFNKKLALGLRIPPSYLDTYSDNIDGSTYNDGRVGTAYIAELRYVGYVKRIQKAIAKPLYANFRQFAKKRGVEFDDQLIEDLIFDISPPQSFAIYKQNELYSTLFNTLSSAENFPYISKRYALERYMDMDKEEIVANEEAVLLEKGIPPGTKLDENIRLNLIYGDGTALQDQASIDNGEVPGEENPEDQGGQFGAGEQPPAGEQ